MISHVPFSYLRITKCCFLSFKLACFTLFLTNEVFAFRLNTSSFKEGVFKLQVAAVVILQDRQIADFQMANVALQCPPTFDFRVRLQD